MTDDFLDIDQFADMQNDLLRSGFLEFCQAALAPLGFTPAAHHRVVIAALQDLAEGVGSDRLIIEAPPGSAKSSYASILFPAWWMSRKGNNLIIGASNASGLALDFSRKVQQTIRDMAPVLGFDLRTEGADSWYATNGGQYTAVGIGGSLQGRRADLFCLDDPFRSREEADSPIMREKAWSWWTSVAEPRMRPGGKMCIITTRWHQDDLVGRLLSIEPDKWRRVRIRAQAKAGEVDPLGREPGVFLWGDDDYGYAGVLMRAKERLERSCAMREWWALYQQEPRPPEGAMFDVAKILEIALLPVLSSDLAGRRSVRAWDFAGTEASEGRDPDWTRGVRITEDGNSFVIDDIKSTRQKATDVDRLVLETAKADGRGVTISIPQDPGAAGKARAEYQAHMLAGFNVVCTRPTGNKSTRATSFAAQVGAGNVRMVTGEWNKAFIEELRDFPYGDHDDIVDASADAFNALLEQPVRKTEQIQIPYGCR